MSNSQHARASIDALAATASYSTMRPIQDAVDELTRLERQQASLSNREVVARELFAKSPTQDQGHTAAQRRSIWDGYLIAEAMFGADVEDAVADDLRSYRAAADAFVTTLRTITS